MTEKSHRLWLSLVVLLLLIAFYVRAHHVTALPPFNDESHHIRRAEQVWTFKDPDLSFTVGKLLTYYWIGIFHPDRLHAIFVARTATALFVLLGFAAAFAVARRLFGAWAGVLTLYLLAFAPFMVFFDRMALSDPLTAALGMVTIAFSLRLVDRPQQLRWGFLSGLAATLTILAKLLGLPFAGIPILAVLMFGTGSLRDRWKRYRETLIICYVTIAAILTPLILRIIYKELAGTRVNVIDLHLINHKTPLEKLADNLSDLWEANTTLNSLAFTLLAVAAIVIALRYRPRRTGFLIACVLAVWGFVIVTSGELSTRYLEIGMPIVFTLVAGALVTVSERLPQRLQLKPQYDWFYSWMVVSVWIAFFAQPFILNSWNDPRLNHDHLPTMARWEYFMNFTAGYGLMDAAAIMPTLEPSTTSGRIPVIGLVGSCHQIRLYLDEFGPVYLECPAFGWEGEFMDDVARYVDQRLTEESVLYLLVEPQLPYTDLSKLHIQHQVIGRFPRPFEGMRVELWRAGARPS